MYRTRPVRHLAVASALLLLSGLVPAGPAGGRPALAGPVADCDSVTGNLVQNCSFEAPPVGDGQFLTFAPGSTGITSWTVGSGNGLDGVDLVHKNAFGAFPVQDGDQSLDLNHDLAGSIFQDLATTPGQQYALTFSLSGYPNVGVCSTVLTKTLTVTVGSAEQDYSFTPDTSAKPPGNQAFAQEGLAFTAASKTTRLTFTSTMDDCAGPIIDNVSVTTRTCDGATTSEGVKVKKGGKKLVGTTGDDTLVADAAGSTLAGKKGNDLLCGGKGNDKLKGGPGDDLQFGLGGNDKLNGSSGNDGLSGGPGDDKLNGKSGTDACDEEGDSKPAKGCEDPFPAGPDRRSR
jgi:choice-of-anchor C domain-containing protein